MGFSVPLNVAPVVKVFATSAAPSYPLVALTDMRVHAHVSESLHGVKICVHIYIYIYVNRCIPIMYIRRYICMYNTYVYSYICIYIY